MKSISPAVSRAAATALSCCGPTISAGLRRRASAVSRRPLEQFAVDLPDAGPQWVADQVFYQIFPDRFARSAARDAEQDAVYYHHAAGREIVRKAWDEPLTGEAGGSTFYGGDLDGISEKLPYLKQLGVTTPCI